MNDNTDLDHGHENDHEGSGLYCNSPKAGKVKPERLRVMVCHTDIVMKLDTGASCSTVSETPRKVYW